MTFFLSNEPEEIKPTGPDLPLAGMASGISAATQKMMIDTDAFMLHDSQLRFERQTTSEPAARRIGIDALNQRYEETGAGYDHLRPAPTTVDDFFAMHGDEASQIVLDMAREAAQADPQAWSDLDLSDEGIDKRTTEYRQSWRKDMEDVIGSMPSGSGIAEFVGGMIGATVDPRNVPFLIAGGGGGSILRVMGREAALNAGAEAVTLPSQYEVSEELGTERPDAVKQLLIGAGAGAILGGATSAIGRAVEYFRGRERVATPNDATAPYHELAVDAAEDAIVKGENPLEAVQKAMRALPEEPPPPREPLIPRAVTPEPTPLAPDPVSSEVLPPPAGERPDTPGEIAAVAGNAIDDAASVTAALEKAAADAKANDAKALRPLIQAMRRAGKGGGTLQVHPDGPFGKELKARGINARSYPGMFSKKGRMDFDNLVASEMEGSFPGISAAAGIADDGMYLNRQGLIDLIEREARGDSSWLQSRMDADRAAKDLDDHLRWVESGGSAADDFIAGARADDGFYVDLDAHEFDPNFIRDATWEAGVERGFDDFVTRRGFRLMDDERAEILSELKARGGDADYLVERAFERERDEWFDKLDGKDRGDEDFFQGHDPFAPFEDAGRGGGAPVGPEPSAAPDGAGRAASVEPARVERTEAGDQLVIPGAEQRAAPAGMTERQRAEMQAQAQQSKIRRGDQTRVEDDANGLFTQHQRDMFDDPTGPQARPAQDAMIEDVRDQIARDGEFKVDMGDGKGERTASSLLDEMDADDEFIAMIDLCGRPRGKE